MALSQDNKMSKILAGFFVALLRFPPRFPAYLMRKR
ncbi:hypothetical protein BMETH_2136_0 [methanotrophic bacterial endosymbiont of Bathymodiolus sp.]|nr:hypothetical protein BMETH_2136_0 [methanotrophic bacterial endosymbiont of Bathymodiolus sp.]